MNIFKTLKYINYHPLARRHRIKAFSRFFKWQVSQKMNPHPVEYPFIGNTKLWIQKGMTGATGNIYTGLHDFEDMSFLLHFLREEDLFIDIGANIGSYTILAAGVTKASCISIEPVPQTFEILEKNITINNLLHKVAAMNIGIGSKNDILSFTNHLDVVNHVILNHGTQEDSSFIQVPCTSLDELLTNRQSPSLIKIDVEGFEQEVMNGAIGLLNNPSLKAIIIELNGSGERYGFDENKIHEQLKGYGFSIYEYEPFKRNLISIADFGNLNTIYIKDIDFVKARLKGAVDISVFSENY